MKEIRRCEICDKWAKKEDCELASVDSKYVPRYSATEGHDEHKFIWVHKICLSDLFD